MDDQGKESAGELDLQPTPTVRSKRPRALWAVLAVVGVAAGALVITSADDDGDQVPGLPIDLAGLAARSGGGDAEAAADGSMPAWVTYVPGDDLPALGGEATAYRLSADVDDERVGRLADAVALEGEVQSDGAGSWWVDAGGNGRLNVLTGHGASWSFLGGFSDCVLEDGGIGACCAPDEPCKTFDTTGVAIGAPGGAGCEAATDDVAVDCAAVPTTSTTACLVTPGQAPAECLPPPPDTVTCDAVAGDCVEAPNPVLPPLEGEDDARRIALDVVRASGFDADGAQVDASAGGESRSWHVTVQPYVDGLPTGLVTDVEVSDAGRVLSGSGYLGPAEVVGEVPLLDTRAAIERANANGGVDRAVDGGVAADDAVSSNTGGTDDVEAPEPGTADPGAATEPCEVPEGASDSCVGTTGCGGDGCVDLTSTTTVPCKAQPDGREICEIDECAEAEVDAPADGPVTTLPCSVPPCPRVVPPIDETVPAPDTVDCPTPPIDPAPVPVPKPDPVEIVLIDAEPSLVILPANDGSGDAYLVPAYRFTAEDGGTVDLPAVADEALAGPTTTETVVPEPAPVDPVPEPQPCEVLEEQDPGTETTHTVQTCPSPNEDALEIGRAYYVDIDVECGGGTFSLGGRIWITDDEEVAGWADPGERHEGGMFTLDAVDHGTFVGDANGTLTAEFRRLGPAEDVFCTPEPR